MVCIVLNVYKKTLSSRVLVNITPHIWLYHDFHSILQEIFFIMCYFMNMKNKNVKSVPKNMEYMIITTLQNGK